MSTVTLVAIICISSYHYFVAGNIGDRLAHGGLGVLTGIVYVVVAYHFSLYSIHTLLRDIRDQYPRVIIAWSVTFLFLSILFFAFKIGNSVSRGSMILFAGIGAASLVTWRSLAKRYLRNAFGGGTIRGRRAIIFGDTSELGSF